MFKRQPDTHQSTTNFLLGCITAGVGILVYLNLEKRFPALQECEEDFADETNSLKDRVRSGATHLKHKVESGVDALKRKTADFRGRAEDLSSQTEDRIREGAKDLKERVGNAIDNVREDISEKQSEASKNDDTVHAPSSGSGDRKPGNGGIIPPSTL